MEIKESKWIILIGCVVIFALCSWTVSNKLEVIANQNYNHKFFLMNQINENEQRIYETQSKVNDISAELEMMVDVLERYELYNEDINFEITLNGIYNTRDKFYSVWTKNRTSEEIASTDIHEKCHALVDNDYGHFCWRG